MQEPTATVDTAVAPASRLWGEIRRRRLLVGFVAIYYVGFAAFGVAAHRSNTGLYLVVTAALIVVFTQIHVRVCLSDRELRALAVLGFLHLAGGLVPAGGERILYNVGLAPYPLEVDRLVHAFGAALLTLVAWRMLRARVPSLDGVAIFLVALAGMGASALGEVAEFVGSRIGPTNVGGYVNTGWDLAFDLMGCSAAAWWLARSRRR